MSRVRSICLSIQSTGVDQERQTVTSTSSERLIAQLIEAPARPKLTCSNAFTHAMELSFFSFEQQPTNPFTDQLRLRLPTCRSKSTEPFHFLFTQIYRSLTHNI